jgi:hypothetical protein
MTVDGDACAEQMLGMPPSSQPSTPHKVPRGLNTLAALATVLAAVDLLLELFSVMRDMPARASSSWPRTRCSGDSSLCSAVRSGARSSRMPIAGGWC